MANKPLDLTNKNPATTNNPDGSLKDQVYSGGSILEVGSKALAKFVQDLLNPFHRLVNKHIVGGLSGVTDEQLGSLTQFYTALDEEMKLQSARAAWQNAIEVWDAKNLQDGGASNYDSCAYGNGIWLFAWNDSGTLKVRRSNDNFISLTTETVGTAVAPIIPSKIVYDSASGKFIMFESSVGAIATLICHTSADGITWAAKSIGTGTSTGTIEGIREANLIGSTIIAFENENGTNRLWTSTDGGDTWNSHDEGVTAPLYFPTATASNGIQMIWADESANLIRISSDGTTWADVTISGGTLNGSYNAVWAGDRFVVFDKESTDYYVSVGPAHTTFNKHNAGLDFGTYHFDSCFYANGIISARLSGTDALYTTTPAGADNEKWYFRASDGVIQDVSISNNKLVCGFDELFVISGDPSNDYFIYRCQPIQQDSD